MTAHVLSATTALLALHQAEQEDVYSQVHSVLNGGRDFVCTPCTGTTQRLTVDKTVNDYDRLYKVFASFQEAARMCRVGIRQNGHLYPILQLLLLQVTIQRYSPSQTLSSRLDGTAPTNRI